MSIKIWLELSILLCATVAQAVQIPVVNGDFEDGPEYPAVSPEGWGIAVTGFPGDIGGLGKFPANASYPPPNGSDYVCIFNRNVSSQVLYQTLEATYTEGMTYTISADLNCGVLLDNWTIMTAILWAVKEGETSQPIAIISVTPDDFSEANQWISLSSSKRADASLDGWNLHINLQVQGGYQPFMDNILVHEDLVPFSVSPDDEVETFENSLSGPTTADFSVVLDQAPTAPVTIDITCDPNITITPSLTFDDTNWDTPQPATVTAIDLSGATSPIRGHWVLFEADSTDLNFDAWTVERSAIVYSDDVPAVITRSEDGMQVSEKDETSDSYTVQLLTSPTDPVFVSMLSDPCEVTITPILTFTVAQWYQSQSVNVTAVDDDTSEGDPHYASVTHLTMSDDPDYEDLEVAPMRIAINDNDCGSWGYDQMDYNEDCIVNLTDFATLASSWMDCTTPYQAGCVQP